MLYYYIRTEKLLVSLDPSKYFFINQGCLTVDNMNDPEEMVLVEVCEHKIYCNIIWQIFNDAPSILGYK